MTHFNRKMNFAKSLLLAAMMLLCGESVSAGNYEVVDGKSVVVKSGEYSVMVTPYNDSIVQILPQCGDAGLAVKESASVVLRPNAAFDVAETASEVKVILKSSLVVSVSKYDGRVSFSLGDELLLKELAPMVKVDGKSVYMLASDEDEAFYGAGERGVSVNLSGCDLVNYNKQNYGYGKGDRTTQMNITMPYYLSSKGYGVFFDDYSASRLVMSNPVRYYSGITNPVPYYFILGEKDNLGGVVKNFTALVGRQELAPLWALGYITSKYGYKTQEETENVVSTFLKRGYPLDGIVLDLYWYGVETDMGRLEWNKKQWSDHRKMLADLKAKGVKTVIISQPYINKIGAIDNYNMAKEAGFLTRDKDGNVHDVTTWVGEAGMFDVSNPATCSWYWNRYKELTDEGVTGWWGDLGEPEVHPEGIVHYNGETAREYHNRYGNDWSRIIYDGFKKEYPDVRLMTLMRGGTAGLQRYSVFPWSTDVGRSWAGLQAQIPIMINSALSGLGYMSHDVGGFAVDPANPIDEELYVRWLQLGLFTPVLRTHSTVNAEPYHYTESEEYMKSLIRQRYAWLPYNYTLAYENAVTGAPLVRPMNYYEPQTVELQNINDQYFWGRDVIVAPIIEKGASDRKVVLPEGVWYDYHDVSRKYTDDKQPKTITYPHEYYIPNPMEVLPIFVREGAIIPMLADEIRNTDEYRLDNVVVKYFPKNGKSSYTIYDDDHKSAKSLESGEYSLIEITADNSTAELVMQVSESGNAYAGKPSSRNFTFVIPMEKAPVDVAVTAGEVTSTEYSATDKMLKVSLRLIGEKAGFSVRK